MSPEFLALFAVVSVLAVSGFVIAEIVRLNFGPYVAWVAAKWGLFPEWDKRKPLLPHFTLAWAVGGCVYVMNFGNWLLQMLTGSSVQTPTSDVDLLTGVMLYPIMCVAMWPMLIKAYQVVAPKDR